jgi:beta-lactamase regulating signal transducer with metallopeptidase domain
MLCILYVNAVSTLLGIVGVLVERMLPATFSRRWIWCLIIPTSIFIPGYYRSHHAMSVTEMLAQQAGRIESFDSGINRVWLTASALLLIWALANAWRVAHLVRTSSRRRDTTGAPLTIDGVPVVVTDSLGPATVGVFRSRVLVPRWVLALPGEQRQYVVRHEDEHRRAHDARLLFVASLALLLMPWNLALWWQLRRLHLAVEMDCDNRVVTGLGDANAYGELLLKIAQATSRGPRLQPALLGGVGMLEHRLTVLLAPTPLRHVQRFLLPALAVGLLFVVFSMPHPVLGPTTHAHLTQR